MANFPSSELSSHAHNSTPIAVLSSLDPVRRTSAVAGIVVDHPAAVVMQHDLLPAQGSVRRRVFDATGLLEHVVTPMSHACMGCALREDVMPTMTRLVSSGRWDAVAIALPVSASPLPVARAIARDAEPSHDRGGVRLAGVVSVVAGESIEADLLGDDLLAERELHLTDNDHRSVGEAWCHQVESATLLIADPVDELAAGLLDHLAGPYATRVPGPHLADWAEIFSASCDLHVIDRWLDPRTRRPNDAVDTTAVWTLDLRSAMPMHPERIRAEIPELCPPGVRIRGAIWLPGRPDTVVEWDGAGNQLSIGAHADWRGSPATRLVVTGSKSVDAAALDAAFQRALLTERELLRGRRYWCTQDDGFDPWLGQRNIAA
ncbi:MAG: GTP-binding protein [Actinomycetota bacterium]